jgi:hypothetical protein
VKVFALIALSGDALFLLWTFWQGDLDSLSTLETFRLVLVHFVFYPSSYWALYWWETRFAEYNAVLDEGDDVV